MHKAMPVGNRWIRLVHNQASGCILWKPCWSVKKSLDVVCSFGDFFSLHQAEVSGELPDVRAWILQAEPC